MMIRHATVDDLAAINTIYNHYIVHTAITFDYDIWSLEKRTAWFKNITDTPSLYHVLVALSDDGNIIGFAYNGEFREKMAYQISSEITIYLTHKHTVKGTGSALMQALLKKMDASPIKRAYSFVALPNPASIALHKKFGFSEVGLLTNVGYKFEQYVSVSILEKSV